jgi:hypothetical protein
MVNSDINTNFFPSFGQQLFFNFTSKTGKPLARAVYNP